MVVGYLVIFYSEEEKSLFIIPVTMYFINKQKMGFPNTWSSARYHVQINASRDYSPREQNHKQTIDYE